MLHTNLTRFGKPGDICFVTSVTKDREPLFADRRNVVLFIQTMREVQAIKNFEIIAYVIMPDHVHMIMRSPHSSTSQIMHSLKWNFTQNWKLLSPLDENMLNPTNLWQKRFWEHVIISDKDLRDHINYIIKNPVKHGFVDDPEDWPYSSFAQNLMNRGLSLEEPILL